MIPLMSVYGLFTNNEQVDSEMLTVLTPTQNATNAYYRSSRTDVNMNIGHMYAMQPLYRYDINAQN